MSWIKDLFFKKNEDTSGTIAILRAEVARLTASGSVEDLEKDKVRLEGTVSSLKSEVEDLKLKRKIEEEDIKHMVKMKGEKLELDFDRRTVEAAGEQQAAIAQVKDDYRAKMEDNLNKQIEDTKEMYAQILERLPNVNVEMTKEL